MGKDSAEKRREKRKRRKERDQKKKGLLLHRQETPIQNQAAVTNNDAIGHSPVSSVVKAPPSVPSEVNHTKSTASTSNEKKKVENGNLGKSSAAEKKAESETDNENADIESRKRSRQKLEFVYPKENGVASSYVFQKQQQNSERKDSIKVDESSAKLINGIKSEHKANSHETIDDILFSSKGKRQRRLSEELSWKEGELTRKKELPQPAATTVEEQEESEGRLSGLSVEEAVRDKTGCRPRANSTDGELNLPRRGLCDERMVLQGHRWDMTKQNMFQVSPTGLSNLGNTCFLNSTIQCLAYLPPFCQSILAMPRENTNNAKNLSQGKKITMLIRSLFQKIQCRDGPTNGMNSLSPNAIVRALPTIGTCGSRNGYRFRPGRQEDAHEFLVHLLDAMHDGELREAGINQHASGWRDRLPIPRLDETTIVHRIFGGYLRSQVRCTKCGYCSNTYDPFLDLALEVSRKSINSVSDAFKEFTRKETLDSENRWKCSGCNKRVCATKQLTVFRPPLSLCVQLKRFSFGGLFGGGKGFKFKGGGFNKGFGMRRGNKISKPIEFPAEMKLPLSDGRSCEYHLTGVVIHVGGSSDSGHYTAFVKRPGGAGKNQWYHIDDCFVQSVSEKTVLQERDAYLLFYCRKEVKLAFPSPPRTISTSAEEAVAHGRARARARTDSITREDSKTSASTGEEEATQRNKKKLEAPSQPQPMKSNVDSKTRGAFVSKTASDESSETSSDESSESHNAPNNISKKEKLKIPTYRAGKPPQRAESSEESSSNSEASENEQEPKGKRNIRLDENSDSCSSSSGFNASEDELEPKKGGNKMPEPEPEPSSKSSDSDSPSRDAATSSSARDPESLSRSDSGTPLLGDNTKSERNGLSAENSKGTIDGTQKKQMKEKQARLTRVVMDRGRGREKVSVMLGPRHKGKKGWKPQTTGTTRHGQDYELLGNRSVDKWSDNATDDAEAPQKASISQARALMVNKLEKDVRSRKRKEYLDTWDAALDRGKTKKVKQKQETFQSMTGMDPSKNAFQKVLNNLKKIKKNPGPKGFFGGGHQTGGHKSKKRKR